MSAGQEIRRVVFGHDASGKAIVLYDGPTPTKMTRPDTGVTARLLWHTDATPADMKNTTDRATIKTGIHPPAGGSVFRIVEFPPIGDISKLGNDFYVREMGTAAPTGKRRQFRHPYMHYTDTIDYAVIISGEIDMLLDDSEVHFKAGDVLVQLGTNHAWVNRSNAPCRIAFVLIDGKDPLAE